MKNKTLASALVLSLIPALALADTPSEYEGWVAGFGEYYNADSDKPLPMGGLDDGTGFGAELGFRFTPKWGARIEWSHLNLDSKSGLADESGDRVGIDGLYFLDQKQTYLFGGFKHQNLEDNYRMMNLGVGRHWDLTEKWKLVTEAAAYYDFGQDFTDYGLKLGLAYTFGHKSKPMPVSEPEPQPLAPVTQAPKDSDMDGVYDDKDRCPNTPRMDKVDSNGCSIFMEEKVETKLDILFANNSYEVGNPDAAQIVEFAEFMRRFPNTQAVIEGHTSTPGKDDYNQTLSENRAKAVRRLLIDRYGIDAGRLQAVGYGESRPLDSANTAEAHKRNRRIHATVSAMEKVKVTK
ncbi:outer membrane porin OprF [Bowmanella denitrificans]|uniref:Outer membrane porin OprF n=1 Tax=Bowmanella denitrificans TaxID=366582 RepID=A0ABP3H586_9ALTE|nr:OmpA family protein [Bowmanella denitrificans]